MSKRRNSHLPELLTSNSHSTSHTTLSTIISIPKIEPQLKKSLRHVKLTSYLQNYHCNFSNNTIQNLEAYVTNSSFKCKNSLQSILSYGNLFFAHKHFTLNLSTIFEPSPYEDAIYDKNKKNAIKIELNTIMKRKT